MLKRIKKLRWPILLVVLFAVGFITLSSPVLAAANEAPVCKPNEIQLNIPFGKSCVTDLADYISIFYRYMVGAIGIVGVAMIMYGGIRWVSSNGNSKEVDEAKQTIISAIVGVALALGSYVLLNFLNPMITQLEDPLKGHTISSTDTTVFCRDKLGVGWQQKVTLDKEDTCGNEFKEKSGGQTCTSDTCGDGQICFNDRINGSGFSCQSAESVCVNADNNSCDQVDAQIARFQSDFGCSKRFSNDFLSAISNYIEDFQPDDKCVYGQIIKPPAGWERVNCTTPTAQHICFEIEPDSGQSFPLDCAGSTPASPFKPADSYGNGSRPCTDKARPVMGADGICIHLTAGNDYQCVN